ncbi:hypothetical protein FHG87_018636 [Trinorchestia longiramus]|nr:hypothetical protein FHG87_018636 [Trinorchestia longiramus]
MEETVSVSQSAPPAADEFVVNHVADSTSESSDEARIPLRAEVLRRPIREQDNRSESSIEARPRYDRKHDIKQSAVSSSSSPSQPPNIRRATLCVSTHFYSLPRIPFCCTPILRHTLCQTLPQIFLTDTERPTDMSHTFYLPSASEVNISPPLVQLTSSPRLLIGFSKFFSTQDSSQYSVPSPFLTPVLAHWWLRYYRRLTVK